MRKSCATGSAACAASLARRRDRRMSASSSSMASRSLCTTGQEAAMAAQLAARHHPRRRRDRRGCHLQCAHHPLRAAFGFTFAPEARGLPADFEVRGEVVMPIEGFLKINREREEQGLAPAANPRNAAAGTIRTLEPNIVAQRRLDFYGYFALRNGENIFWRAVESAGCALGRRLPRQSAPQGRRLPRRSARVHRQG